MNYELAPPCANFTLRGAGSCCRCIFVPDQTSQTFPIRRPTAKAETSNPLAWGSAWRGGKGNDHAYRGDSLPASDTPRSAGGQARACPICARGDDRTRSAQMLFCADTSHNGLSTARVGSSAKASRPWLSGDMVTPSNDVERCSPFCWTTARVILLFPAQKSNTCWPNDLRSRSA